MSTQITWRNIDAPDLVAASRPLGIAQQSFGSAFDTLGQVLQRRESTDAANWQTQKGNNTQAFLNELYKFRTPEQLAAARASGELDSLQAGFGAQIDQAAVRGAADTRLNTLYDQAKTANAFTDQQQERDLRPLVQQAKALAANGDSTGVQALLAANPALAQRYAGELVSAGVIGEREAVKFAQGNVKFGDDLATSANQRATSAKNADSSRISANASAANAKTNADQLRLQVEDRLTKALKEETEAAAKANMTVGTEAGTKYVIDGIDKAVKDPEQRAELIAAFGKMASSKEFKDVKPEMALNALLQDSDTLMFPAGWSSENILRQALKGQVPSKASVEARPAAAAAIGLPPPTPVPANTRPVRGPALLPWEQASNKLPKEFVSGDPVYDAALSSELAKMKAEKLLPLTGSGEIDMKAIQPGKLEDIRNRTMRSMFRSSPDSDR